MRFQQRLFALGIDLKVRVNLLKIVHGNFIQRSRSTQQPAINPRFLQRRVDELQ